MLGLFFVVGFKGEVAFVGFVEGLTTVDEGKFLRFTFWKVSGHLDAFFHFDRFADIGCKAVAAIEVFGDCSLYLIIMISFAGLDVEHVAE